MYNFIIKKLSSRHCIFVSIFILSILSFNESLAQNKRSATYDFNGDGRSDLLVRNIKSNSIFYFYIKAKNIQQHTLGKKKGTIVGVGDYNGDGIADILFRRGKSGAIGYWIVKQDSFKETVHLKKRTEAEWDVVRFYNRTDFDGNGLDDILWRSNKGELKIYYMTRGKKTKYKTLSLNTDASDIKIIGSGDFNRDGRTDILWENTITGRLGYYQMNGIIETSVDLIFQLDQPSAFATVGDFNGDGFSDIYGRLDLQYGYWAIKAADVSAFKPDFTVLPELVLYRAGHYFPGGSDHLGTFRSPLIPGLNSVPYTLFFYEFHDGFSGGGSIGMANEYFSLEIL